MSGRTVCLVDDDAAVRDSIALLCETAHIALECYAEPAAFLAAYTQGRFGCVVLDMQMPGMTGLELHAEMRRRGIDLPVVYLTAHGDIPTTVQAMKLGATDFLTKPVDGATFLARVRSALGTRRVERVAAPAAKRGGQLATLTRREREITLLAVQGHSNKEIARRLGISYRTVEIHRSRALRKSGAANLLELARMVAGDAPAATGSRSVGSVESARSEPYDRNGDAPLR